MSPSGRDLINNYELFFDGTDMHNASLYLCVSPDMKNEAQIIISALRDRGLWSADEAKVVPPEHKPMYAEQMQFIGCIAGQIDGKTFYVAAFNHEKFPYQAVRWQDWQDFITSRFDI